MNRIYVLLLICALGTQPVKANNLNLLLETCGALSFQGIYITFTAIGTLSDGYTAGMYDKEFASGLMSEYIILSTTVNEQLNTLLKANILSSEDTAFIIELNNIYQLLISEAQAYIDYLASGEESYIYIYDSNRTKAWDKIAKLFELE